MKDLFQKCLDFLKEGNNMYYAIGAVIIIVLVIVAILVVAIKKGRAKRAEDETTTRIEKIDREKESIAPAVVKADEKIAADDAKAQQKPLHKPKPEPKPTEKPKTVVKVASDVGYGYQNEESAVNDIIKEREIAEDIEKENDLIKTVEVKPVPEKVKPVKQEEKKEEPLKYVKKEVEDDEVANKRPGTIQIYKDAAGKYRYRFWAANSLMVGHSRAYDTKAHCRKAINEIKKIADMAVIADTTKGEEPNVPTGTPIFEIYRDSENKFRFRLVTGIRVTKYLLASQGYTSKENCLKGIASIRYISGNHKIKDTAKATEKEEAKSAQQQETKESDQGGSK